MPLRMCRMCVRKNGRPVKNKNISLNIAEPLEMREACSCGHQQRTLCKACIQIHSIEDCEASQEEIVYRKLKNLVVTDRVHRKGVVSPVSDCAHRQSSRSRRGRLESQRRIKHDPFGPFGRDAYLYYQNLFEAQHKVDQLKTCSSSDTGNRNSSEVRGRPSERRKHIHIRDGARRIRIPIGPSSSTRTNTGGHDPPMHEKRFESSKRHTSAERRANTQNKSSVTGSGRQQQASDQCVETVERSQQSGPSLADSRREQSGPSLADSRREQSGPSLADSRREQSGPSLAEQENASTSGPTSKVPPPVSSADSVNVIFPPIEAQRPPSVICKFCTHTPYDNHHLFESYRGVTCHRLSQYMCHLCGEKGKHSFKYCPRNPLTRGDPKRAQLPPGPATREHLVAVHRLLGENKPKICLYCMKRDLSYFHPTQMNGVTTCPEIRKLTCPKCGQTGDHAHTVKFCPSNKRNRRLEGDHSSPHTENASAAQQWQPRAGLSADSENQVQTQPPISQSSIAAFVAAQHQPNQPASSYGEQPKVYKVMVAPCDSTESFPVLANAESPVIYPTTYYVPRGLNVNAPEFPYTGIQNYEYQTSYAAGNWQLLPNSYTISETERNNLYPTGSDAIVNKAIPIVHPTEVAQQNSPEPSHLQSSLSNEGVSLTDEQIPVAGKDSDLSSESNDAITDTSIENSVERVSSQHIEGLIESLGEDLVVNGLSDAAAANQTIFQNPSVSDYVESSAQGENQVSEDSSEISQENSGRKSWAEENSDQNESKNNFEGLEAEGIVEVPFSSSTENADAAKTPNGTRDAESSEYHSSCSFSENGEGHESLFSYVNAQGLNNVNDT